MEKILLVSLLALAASMLAPVQASAAGYPERPIRLVVPLTAGGGGDIAARAVAAELAQTLKQPVVVENRPGAGTQIGTDIVTKAAPDGYTLLLLVGDIAAIDKAFNAKLPYDVSRDLVLVSGVASIPLVLIVNPDLGVRSLDELVVHARQAPGKLKFASLGTSSPHFIFFERFKRETGIEVADIPYKSTSQATIDLVGGRVDLTMIGEVNAANQARDGRARPLAITSAQRGKVLPDTPTFTEYRPGLVMVNWYVLAAPAGTPPDVIEILHKSVSEALRQEAVVQRLATIGLSPWSRDPSFLATFFPEEIKHYGEQIRQSGARQEGR
ncbi:Bug family tripartite tricarboxylate transporter substrate binding protein [Achromobacter insolitus]|uniref:Bug family tripartite tricarboxylate transporter substrate binding protein n=1 Tax=Achromobacter insolitus TaxID=217204 RepID=UPI002FDE37C2